MTAFESAWDFLKEDRPLGCPNCEGKIDDTGEPSFPIPNEDRSSSTGYRCWKCGSEV